MPPDHGEGAQPRDRGRPPPVRKSLGQHFLGDPRILGRIAGTLALRGGETVIEIGPGRGALSDALLPQAGRLILIEYDRALAGLLRARYAATPRVEVVEADVLAVDLAALAGGPFVLAGNIPYYITTPILFHALRSPRPDRAVFLVQREVAERVVAPAGSDAYGALSVNVQALAEPSLEFRVPAGAFMPPPKVDSAVLRLEPRAAPLVAAADEDPFRRLVQGAFGMRRKQMRRVARALFGLDAAAADALLAACGIDPAARPETLPPERFAALFENARS